MSWLWHCLQIWDSSRITAASCTSVFVLFLYKDLSKGKTSLGEKKWHLHPVFVCELLSAAYTVLLCIENTWLLLISYRKSDHWHVRAPSSQWHHWLKLTLLNNTWWLLSQTAQSLMSYAWYDRKRCRQKQHRKLLLSSLASNLLSVTSSSVSLLPIKAHSQTTCHEGHLWHSSPRTRFIPFSYLFCLFPRSFIQFFSAHDCF